MAREQHNDLDEAADFSHWRISATFAKEFVVHSNRVNFIEASRHYKRRAQGGVTVWIITDREPVYLKRLDGLALKPCHL